MEQFLKWSFPLHFSLPCQTEKARAQFFWFLFNCLTLCFLLLPQYAAAEQTPFAITSKQSASYGPAPPLHEKTGEVGTASWYDASTSSRQTASGVALKSNDFTAAHPSLPFGTVVRVYNLSNNKQALVVITDRGPFSKKRIIDVSRRTAAHLEMLRSGIAKVSVEVVSTPTGAPIEKGNKFFLKLGTVASAQAAHETATALEKNLKKNIRALHTESPSNGYALCLGPYDTFAQARVDFLAVEQKRPVLEIVEAPANGETLPLCLPPHLRKGEKQKPRKAKPPVSRTAEVS